MARVKQDLRDALEPSGFPCVGANRVFMMVSMAVQAYAVWWRDRHGMALPDVDTSPGTAGSPR